jgi:hypothetical protein
MRSRVMVVNTNVLHRCVPFFHHRAVAWITINGLYKFLK